jgi:hypothetical protein
MRMDETKLTIRVPKDLLEKAKQYAAQNRITLTDLIESYFHNIPTQGDLENAPIVRRLSGVISPTTTIEDYHKHLDEKYGR